MLKMPQKDIKNMFINYVIIYDILLISLLLFILSILKPYLCLLHN